MSGPRRRRNWGYENNHHLVVTKKAPDSLVELRTMLLYPEHADIFAAASVCPSFEECIACIATHLGIVLDGMYEGELLCAMLVDALKHRGMAGYVPAGSKPASMLLDPTTKEATISFDPTNYLGQIDIQKKLDPFSVFMQEHGCRQCDNTALCKRAGKCLGDDSRAPETTAEVQRAMENE